MRNLIHHLLVELAVPHHASLAHLALAYFKLGFDETEEVTPLFQKCYEVGKGGVVRDSKLHQKVVDQISHFSRGLGLDVGGVIESPLLGPKGNKEFFIHLKK